MLLFSPLWLFIYPGLIMLVLGSASVFTIMVTSVRTSSIAFSVNTLIIGAALTALGYQLVSLGIFIKDFDGWQTSILRLMCGVTSQSSSI